MAMGGGPEMKQDIKVQAPQVKPDSPKQEIKENRKDTKTVEKKQEVSEKQINVNFEELLKNFSVKEMMNKMVGGGGLGKLFSLEGLKLSADRIISKTHIKKEIVDIDTDQENAVMATSAFLDTKKSLAEAFPLSFDEYTSLGQEFALSIDDWYVDTQKELSSLGEKIKSSFPLSFDDFCRILLDKNNPLSPSLRTYCNLYTSRPLKSISKTNDINVLLPYVLEKKLPKDQSILSYIHDNILFHMDSEEPISLQELHESMKNSLGIA